MSKIQVFVRHCHYSKISAHKKRLPGFSHEKCHENFLASADFSQMAVTFLLDTHYAAEEKHFVQKQHRFPVFEIDVGTETGSFLALLDLALSQNFSDDTILYFLEDDYLHRPNWVHILREAFFLPKADYVTLFDHRDKYTDYPDLQSSIFFTPTCHWRTTPSTTNTFAMRVSTLKEDLDIHKQFSVGRTITADHEKFCALGERGRTLLSSLPGYSTHVEAAYCSPCFNWHAILDQLDFIR